MLTFVRILTTLLVGLFWVACGPGPQNEAPSKEQGPAEPGILSEAVEPVFVERAAASGLDFHHFNGMSGQYYFHEMMGSGAAFLDYDRDGDLDVYLVQGSLQGTMQARDAVFPPAEGQKLIDRLFRNEIRNEDGGLGELLFTDVTEGSGIVGDDYGMGVATGDIDNDGWTDLYVTSFEGNHLWHNDGEGHFSDWTERSGVGELRWSVPAVFFDFDRDGWLDLFVGNYVDFTVATHKSCSSELGGSNYCGPMAYAPVTDRLFRNRGDGTFEDVSGRSGISRIAGSTLGAVVGDFDADGWPDLYVTNDQMRNFLWINQGDGTFNDGALLAGCAVNREGRPEASMGVEAVDFDGDGDEDLFMAHLRGETNTLFVNDGTGFFEDRSSAAGIDLPSLEFTSFGIGVLDVDRDGWPDLIIANGAVKVIEELVLEGDPYPLHQHNQWLMNRKDGTFEDRSDRAGPFFELSEVSRTTLLGDVDEDGDTDVLITNNGGPVRLLINQAAPEAQWVGLRILEPDSRRPAIGAWAILETADGVRQSRRVRTSSSYLAANDPRLVFGLGTTTPSEPLKLEVHWPDGSRESWQGIEPGAYREIVRGEGQVIP